MRPPPARQALFCAHRVGATLILQKPFFPLFRKQCSILCACGREPSWHWKSSLKSRVLFRRLGLLTGCSWACTRLALSFSFVRHFANLRFAKEDIVPRCRWCLFFAFALWSSSHTRSGQRALERFFCGSLRDRSPCDRPFLSRRFALPACQPGRYSLTLYHISGTKARPRMSISSAGRFKFPCNPLCLILRERNARRNNFRY